jgi:hypothetical protein
MRVIGMVVREEHRVDPIHCGCNELKSELGRRVDEDSSSARRLDERAHARALVSRIR